MALLVHIYFIDVFIMFIYILYIVLFYHFNGLTASHSERERNHEPPRKQERANKTTQPNTDGDTVKSLVKLNNQFINTKQAKNTNTKNTRKTLAILS